MPKDWKRYTTAGLTFATIIVIGFVMQNGQKAGPQEQMIATANMGQPPAPAMLSQPMQDPAQAPGSDMAAGMAMGADTSVAALNAGMAADDGDPGPKEQTLVASLADTVTWGSRGSRDRSSQATAGANPAATTDKVEEIISITPEPRSAGMTIGDDRAMPSGPSGTVPKGLSPMGTSDTAAPAAESFETASLGSAGSAPTPAKPREDPVASGNCEITMKAAPQAAALVDLTLEAPCLPNERVTLHHNGMMFTETTDMQGNLALSVPALTENAVFIASFANGDGAVANATVTSLGFYDRAVVQSETENAVGLHALEFGADYDDQGHIWSNAPGDIASAAQGKGGFLMVLGNPAIAKGMMAQVYSFPAGFASTEGDIALSVEIEVTSANCGRPVDAQSIEAVQGGALSVQTLEMTMPDCDAVGDFLVLKNLVNDLKVAKN